MRAAARDVIQRLEHLGLRVRTRRADRAWSAQCPAHNDGRHLSLAVTVRGDRALVKCFAGCSFEEIRAALGFSSSSALSPFKSQNLDACGPSTDLRERGGRSGGLPSLTPDVLRCANSEKLLELYAAGKLVPAKICAPPLPKRAGRVIRVVYADIVLITALRLAVGNKWPVPYAQHWAASRLGENSGSIRRALDWLVDKGLIVARRGLPPKDVSALEDLPSSERRKWTHCYVLAGALPVQPGASEASLGASHRAGVQPPDERDDLGLVETAELGRRDKLGVLEVRHGDLCAPIGGASGLDDDVMESIDAAHGFDATADDEWDLAYLEAVRDRWSEL